MRLRAHPPTYVTASYGPKTNGHVKDMSCAWSGRGEMAGIKGRAYQHRPNFYLSSAGLRLSFCSVPEQSFGYVQCRKFEPFDLQFPSPQIATFTLQARVQRALPCSTGLSSPSVFVTETFGTLQPAPCQRKGCRPRGFRLMHSLTVRAANRMHKACPIPAQLSRIARSAVNPPSPTYHCVGPP